jgi:hypothetical protein
MRKKKSEDVVRFENIPCGFGCGAHAQGSISVHYSAWGSRAAFSESNGTRLPDPGLSFHVPCCYACARGSIKMQVTIPQEKKP